MLETSRQKLKQFVTRQYDKILSFAAEFNATSTWYKLPSRLENFKYKCIHLAAVNFCNARCVFCGQHKFKRPSETMDRDLFVKLANDGIEMGITEMDFTPPLGDPLLDTNFVERAQYAKSIGYKKLYMTTNGILLPKYYIQVGDLFEVIRISIGGLDKETYKKAYVVDRFNDVYDGILLLLEYIQYKYPSKRNVHLFFRTEKTPKEITNTIWFKEIKRIGGKSLTYEFTNFYDNWGGSVRPTDLIGEMKMRTEKRKVGVPCRALFDFFVEYQGNVRLCGCRFLDKEDDELVIGNVAQESLKSILSPERILTLMKKFKSEETLPDVCKGCTLYRPIL